MRLRLCAALVVCFIVTHLTQLQAQRFEFVENKGQWDSKVNFLSNTEAGELYLQSAGLYPKQQGQ